MVKIEGNFDGCWGLGFKNNRMIKVIKFKMT